jgi:uncharacterized protein (TIGR03083 family)
MDLEAYLGAIDRESADLAAAAARAGLGARVPSCPEWTVAELVGHQGVVHRWATATVGSLSHERISWRSLSGPPGDDALLDWFREGSAALVQTLKEADPDAPVWTFLPDGRVSFWFRRQALETAVHRWDAQLAARSPQPIEAELAADGVDEELGFRVALGRLPDEGGATVHLHCTDVEGEWLIRLGRPAEIERVHAKGDAAARGGASELLLVVWGRRPVTTLDVFGDVRLLIQVQEGSRA